EGGGGKDLRASLSCCPQGVGIWSDEQVLRAIAHGQGYVLSRREVEMKKMHCDETACDECAAIQESVFADEWERRAHMFIGTMRPVPGAAHVAELATELRRAYAEGVANG